MIQIQNLLLLIVITATSAAHQSTAFLIPSSSSSLSLLSSFTKSSTSAFFKASTPNDYYNHGHRSIINTPLVRIKKYSQSRYTSSRTRLLERKSDNMINNDNDEIKNDNIIAQSTWYAAEAFGKLFGSNKANNTNNANASSSLSSKSIKIDLNSKPSSINETIQRIKLDNDRFYFLSGQVDALSYDPQCYFADPFIGFEGTNRFVENLQNLGSFITKYDVKMLRYDVSDDYLVVNMKVMVKLELNLPWKPILAWPWGVRYDIDPETFLIVKHVESWDIEPIEGVKQVFRKPTLQI